MVKKNTQTPTARKLVHVRFNEEVIDFMRFQGYNVTRKVELIVTAEMEKEGLQLQLKA